MSSCWGARLLDLPFSAWGTFVIEERFGFNRTSRGTFLSDRLKGLAVSLLLGVPLLLGFLALFEYGGSWAWVYAWIAAALFSVVMQVLAPTLIMPLFNKFTPVEEGELKDAIIDYARRVDFPLQGVFTIDASRRSTKGNAFFTGFGKSKRIALFDTLVQRHPTDELVTVLAHEVGHYKKRHILLGTVLSIVEMGIFLGLFALLVDQPGLFAAFGVDTPSTYAGVVFVSILLRPLQLVLSIAGAALSRRHERQADRFAAEHHGKGRSPGFRPEAPLARQPQQPHAASCVRLPQLLPPAAPGEDEGALSARRATPGADGVRLADL